MTTQVVLIIIGALLFAVAIAGSGYIQNLPDGCKVIGQVTVKVSSS